MSSIANSRAIYIMPASNTAHLKSNNSAGLKLSSLPPAATVTRQQHLQKVTPTQRLLRTGAADTEKTLLAHSPYSSRNCRILQNRYSNPTTAGVYRTLPQRKAAPLLSASSSSMRIYQNRHYQPQQVLYNGQMQQSTRSKLKLTDMQQHQPQQRTIYCPQQKAASTATTARKIIVSSAPIPPQIMQSSQTTVVKKPQQLRSGIKRPYDHRTESYIDIDEVYELISEMDEECATPNLSDGTTLNSVPRKRERLTHLTPEEKLNRRKMKNRVAAQTARDRKKERTQRLEQAVKSLLNETNGLRSENRSLRAKVKRLEQQLQKKQQIPVAYTNTIDNYSATIPERIVLTPSSTASSTSCAVSPVSSDSSWLADVSQSNTINKNENKVNRNSDVTPAAVSNVHLDNNGVFESAEFINEPQPRDQAPFYLCRHLAQNQSARKRPDTATMQFVTLLRTMLALAFVRLNNNSNRKNLVQRMLQTNSRVSKYNRQTQQASWMKTFKKYLVICSATAHAPTSTSIAFATRSSKRKSPANIAKSRALRRNTVADILPSHRVRPQRRPKATRSVPRLRTTPIIPMQTMNTIASWAWKKARRIRKPP